MSSNFLNLPPVQYTQKDSQSILSDMISGINTLTTRWTDFNPSDIGVVILELLAWSEDNLLFYLDHQANEAFLATAVERKNVAAHCALIGYRMAGYTGSTTTLQFTVPAAATAPVPIPMYTVCSTSGSPALNFATTQNVVIPTGQTSVSVGAREGTPVIIQGTTTGVASQTFSIPDANADTLSFQVVINGVIWAQVDTFAESESSDLVYFVNIAANGSVSVVLGDGFFGYLPPASTIPNVTITYLATDGSTSDAGIGAITTIVSNLGVSITVTNVEAATGGADPETIEHAKATAPATLAAIDRAVTKADYVALTEAYPGVGKAIAWGESESATLPNYNLFNWVMVVAAPEGVQRADLIADPLNNGKLSTEAKEELRDYLYTKACITTKLDLQDPTYKGIDLTVSVYVPTNLLPSNVTAAVSAAVIDYFDFDNMSFAVDIHLSQIYKLIMDTAGVAYTQVSLFKSDAETPAVNGVIAVGFQELPFLRTFTLNSTTAVSTAPPPTLLPTAPVPNPLAD